MTVEKGIDVTIYVGTLKVTSISINDEALDTSNYYVKDYTLHISGECFEEGDNEVCINDDITFNVEVINMDSETIINHTTKGCGGSILASSLVVFICAAFGVILLLVKKYKED